MASHSTDRCMEVYVGAGNRVFLYAVFDGRVL